MHGKQYKPLHLLLIRKTTGAIPKKIKDNCRGFHQLLMKRAS